MWDVVVVREALRLTYAFCASELRETYTHKQCSAVCLCEFARRAEFWGQIPFWKSRTSLALFNSRRYKLNSGSRTGFNAGATSTSQCLTIPVLLNGVKLRACAEPSWYR